MGPSSFISTATTQGLIQQGVKESGLPPVRIVDGTEAGIQLFEGLARLATSWIRCP